LEEFWNVVAATIAALVLGLAIHSAYRHTFNGKKKKGKKGGGSAQFFGRLSGLGPGLLQALL
jgi:hypothetical protein